MKQSRIRSTSPTTNLASPRGLSTRELSTARGGTFGGGLSYENFTFGGGISRENFPGGTSDTPSS
jgi:hypothetical protein